MSTIWRGLPQTRRGQRWRARYSGAKSFPIVTTDNLDFLRGAAALHVVLGHARGLLFMGGRSMEAAGSLGWFDYAMLGLLQLTSLGTEAVTMFYIVSGFAMARSIEASRSFGSFYAKRVVRLWPLFLMALAFGALVCRWIGASFPQSHVWRDCAENLCTPGAFLAHAVYLRVDAQIVGHFWSLPHEVFFYALCPIILASVTRVRVFWGLALMLAIGFAVAGLRSALAVGFVTQFGGVTLLLFMTGALAGRHQHLLPRASGRTLLVLLVATLPLAWILKIRSPEDGIFFQRSRSSP